MHLYSMYLFRYIIKYEIKSCFSYKRANLFFKFERAGFQWLVMLFIFCYRNHCLPMEIYALKGFCCRTYMYLCSTLCIKFFFFNREFTIKFIILSNGNRVSVWRHGVYQSHCRMIKNLCVWKAFFPERRRDE